MAEFSFSLTAAPVLGGADPVIGANRIVERDDLALVSVATALGGDAALAAALDAGWRLPVPDPTRSAVGGETRALRTAPDQMMLIFPHPTPDAERAVSVRLAGTGYTTDQTDAWVVLELSGPDTLSALERLCPLDVAGMEPNGAARTVMDHMGAIIIRLGDSHVLLLSASSSATSFLEAVERSFRYVLAD